MYRYKIGTEKTENTSQRLSDIIVEIENLSKFVAGTVYILNTPILKFSVTANGVMWFSGSKTQTPPKGLSDLT